MSKNKLPTLHARNIAQRESELAREDVERRLDKMHVSKMARACMGVMVAFAFDDEQAFRAACWFLAHCAFQLGKTREAAMEQAGVAWDLVHAEQAPDSVSSVVKPSGIVTQ
jgi:predicted RNase H-like HicB family nuclease